MIVRGYCQTKEQEIILRVLGLTTKQIYREGFKGETLAACLRSFRGARGTLQLGITADTSRISRGKIRVVGASATLYEELKNLVPVITDARSLRLIFNATEK